MSSPTFDDDDDGIGPRLTLDEVAIPPHVGEPLAAFYDREGRIETVREWADAAEAAIRTERDRAPAEADMCVAADGPHAVEFADETISYVCVLDPLIAVFLHARPGTVRSETPEDGAEVAVEIDADGATATPADAVVSVGVGRDGPEDEPTLEGAYGQLCAYTHVFASVDEYERWAAGVDAATTSYPVETGVALAREFVRMVDIEA
jgi:hypothetical protein